jgi:hypothetical protein
MAREGGCEWYQSIGLFFRNISADFKKLFKGPRRHWIKELAGLKTGKKHDRGAPYLLIQHDSGCGRHKVKNPPKYIDKKSAKFSVAAGLSNRPVARSHIAVGAMGLPPLHVVCGGAGQLWIPRT